VGATGTGDVVLGGGVGEVVDLNALVDAVFDERERMLPHDGVVDRALADQQLAEKIVAPPDERSLFEAFRIGLRVIHIPLAVHHFIPLPVDDGAAGDADLEGRRIMGHQRNGHESAVAPSMHADPLCIDPGLAFQHVDAHHLVGHFGLPACAVDGLFVGRAAIRGAAVVLDIDDVSLLGHQHLPEEHFAEPGVLDKLGMGAAVDIDDDGILLRRVEAERLDEAIIIVILAVRALDLSEVDLALGKAGDRVGGAEELVVDMAGGAPEIRDAGGGEVAVVVEIQRAVDVERNLMPAGLLGHAEGLAYLGVSENLLALGRHFQIDLEKMVLNRGNLGRGVKERRPGMAGIGDIGRDRRYAAEGRSERIAEVETAVAVAVVGAIEEDIGAFAEKAYGVERLHPGVILLGQQRTQFTARDGAVAVEMHLVLAPGEDLDPDLAAVGGPADVRQVALVGKVVDVHPDRLPAFGVIDPEGDELRDHAVHRVADLLQRAGAGGDVQKGKFRHAGLVLAVESDLPAVRRPEDAPVDAEFVAADALAIDDAVGAFRDEGPFPVFIDPPQAAAEAVGPLAAAFRLAGDAIGVVRTLSGTEARGAGAGAVHLAVFPQMAGVVGESKARHPLVVLGGAGQGAGLVEILLGQHAASRKCGGTGGENAVLGGEGCRQQGGKTKKKVLDEGFHIGYSIVISSIRVHEAALSGHSSVPVMRMRT